MIIYPVIAAAVVVIDQITKYMVRSAMAPGDSIPVIGSWLRILYVRNTGTAFSMFEGNKWITLMLTSVLIIACLIYVIREVRAGARAVPMMLTLVIAGGLSNLIDRFALGYVTDMISCGRFAVFNVADIAVTCGCALTIVAVFLEMKHEEKHGS